MEIESGFTAGMSGIATDCQSISKNSEREEEAPAWGRLGRARFWEVSPRPAKDRWAKVLGQWIVGAATRLWQVCVKMRYTQKSLAIAAILISGKLMIEDQLFGDIHPLSGKATFGILGFIT